MEHYNTIMPNSTAFAYVRDFQLPQTELKVFNKTGTKFKEVIDSQNNE